MSREGHPRKAAFAFIYVTVLLDILALGVMVPVVPKLVISMQSGSHVRAAWITGVFGFVWAAMQFIFAPVLGSLSDRFGRRSVILLSSFGLGLDYILMAVAPSIGWLFLGRVISGVTAATYPTAVAYVADVTPPEKRAGRFGYLSSAFGLGFILGPAFGGTLASIDLRLPFWVSAGLCLLNTVYGYFVLPESLAKKDRMPFEWRVANPFGSLKFIRARPKLLLFSFVVFLYSLAHESLPAVFVLYTDHRYQWDERVVGFALGAIGVCSTLVSAGLTNSFVKRFGEAAAIVFGLGCAALGFCVYGIAPTGATFVIGIPLMAIWGISGPAMQSIMSRSVGAREQGKLQGASSCIRGVAGMLGPLLFTQVYAISVWQQARTGFELSGAPYLLAAVLVAGSAFTAWIFSQRERV